MRPMIWIAWPGIMLMVFLLVAIARGLANSAARPFLVGLGALVGLGMIFLVTVRGIRVEAPLPPVAIVAERMRPATERPVPSPHESSAPEVKRPKMTVIEALRQAIVQAWIGGPSSPASTPVSKPAANEAANVPVAKVPAAPVAKVPVAEAHAITEASEMPAKAIDGDVRTLEGKPGWVDVEAHMAGSDWVTTVQTDPLLSPLECQRELPKALQAAVSEYADLLLGADALPVTLPDDVLRQLVHKTWTEVRPMPMESGTMRDMYILHAQVVFDGPMQQQVKSAAESHLIHKRLQGAAKILSVVIGLLAVTWAGLRFATRGSRAETVVRQAA
jgi:hypothetical protein